jgi:hypothetical protein
MATPLLRLVDAKRPRGCLPEGDARRRALTERAVDLLAEELGTRLPGRVFHEIAVLSLRQTP